MSIVTIIGAGMMGSALAFPAAENGHEVRLVGTHLDRDIIEACRKTGRHPKFAADFPAHVRYFHIEDMKTALDGADMLIGGVSSFGVDWFGEAVLPFVPAALPVLTVTKGLLDGEDGSVTTYPEFWQRALAPKQLCLNAVGGPCTSYELVAHDPTVVTFCGADLGVLAKMKKIMQTPYYHIALSADLRGVENAVALKNAYALGVTLSLGVNERVNGLGAKPHYNSQAALFGQGVKEMRALMKIFGGTEDSLDVGIGDLYVTVFGGRTRITGTLLGRGLSRDAVMKELEGVTLESNVITTRMARAVRKAAALKKLDASQFPLLLFTDDVLNNGAKADIPWDAFVR
ncbi:MAG: glycerol-3-phosphate dehydrogenase [Clostridiales bacterium]|jgi:glycerol-3-phosphate dehydrogenase (NAD(P)+)|nr:glycerol-3-phosphate dehydrogenase [Clostridiales bacterium]